MRRRRPQAAQHAHRDREEGQVGRDDRHGHPRPPGQLADVQPTAPAHDQRRQRDQRHGLGQHHVRQQTALGDREAVHEHAEAEADDDAEQQPDHRHPEGEPRRVEHGDRRPGRCPRLRTPAGRSAAAPPRRAASRRRRLAAARAPRTPIRRPGCPLPCTPPTAHRRRPPTRRTTRPDSAPTGPGVLRGRPAAARRPRRGPLTPARPRHRSTRAGSSSVTAGITCSPYAASVESLPSCCR